MAEDPVAEDQVAARPALRGDYLPFLALEAATLIAGVGNGVAAIALPWLTLRLTDDPAAAGMVVAAGAIPTLLASLTSGVIIDRLGRQRTSVGSDIFSAVSAAAIPVLGLLGMLTYPLVLIASVVGAVFDPVGVTAREAMLPAVARIARAKLERVNGIHEAVWGMAWLIGPGIAGLLIGWVGPVASFWAMFVGFVASALLVGTAAMPASQQRPGGQHWLRDALDGLRFVLGNPAVRSTGMLSTVVFTFAYSVIAVVLPVMYERLDRPEQLGSLFVAYSGGGILGALVYSGIGLKLRRRPVFVGGLVATTAIPAAYAFEPSYLVQLVVMAVAGFVSGAVNPIANVVLQERADEEIRGRALSIIFALAYALYPVGYVAAGFMVKSLGLTATFGWMASGTAVFTLWSAVTPALRDIETPESVTASG